MPWGAVIGSVIGGGISALGSTTAAGEEAGAAESAVQLQENEFNTITQQESPWMTAGQGAQSQLNYLEGIGTPGQGTTAASSTAGGFGSLNQQFNTSDWQSLSPSYNFQLQQGQQGVLNQDSGALGAESGAALKDLISYNQNTANTSFNSAYNMYQQQQQNIYNRLQGTSQLGQNAAANTGQQGTALAGNAGQATIAAGNAIGSGISSAANSLGNSASTYGAYASLGQNNTIYDSNSDVPGMVSY